MLQDAKADIKVHFGPHGSALECAIRKLAMSLVTMLLDYGAEIDYLCSDQGNTPLSSAVMIEDVDMVSFLLDHGSDVNSPAAIWGGRTALQWAALKVNMKIFYHLLNAGADINVPLAPVFAVTTLLAAVSQQNYELVCLLLASGACLNDSRGEMTALEAAARMGDIWMARILLIGNARANTDCSLSFAFKNSNTKLVSIFLEAGADVNGFSRRHQNLIRSVR